MSIMITPAELKDMIGTDRNPTILDVRWTLSMAGPGAPGGEREKYRDGHVPGAVYVDLDDDLSDPPTPTSSRHPLPGADRFGDAMRRAGVTAERPVVVYDQRSGMGAARGWWLLTDAGHTQVHVLEGGYDAWLASGGEAQTGDVTVPVSTWQPEPGHLDHVDADGVEAAVAAGRRVLDVRAGERYRGETEPLDPAAGHVPGAVSLPVSEIVNPDGTRKDPADVRAAAGELGDGDVIYCGSGITASYAAMLLRDAGITGPMIYPGSWSEWSRQGRPVATGAEPGRP